MNGSAKYGVGVGFVECISRLYRWVATKINLDGPVAKAQGHCSPRLYNWLRGCTATSRERSRMNPWALR